MFKASNIIFFLITCWCAFLLFWTSQSVHNKDKVLKELQKSSFQEQEYTRVLYSEWDYLTRPERIEVLAQKYFSDGNLRNNSSSILSSASYIQDLIIPAVPKQKPKMDIRHISSAKEITFKEVPSWLSTSSNLEKDKLNNLVNELSSKGDIE